MMANTEVSSQLEQDFSKVIRIDSSEIHAHIDSMVRETVEDTLNKMLEAEADRLCKAAESEDRRRTRRALTEEELRHLLVAARLRPLAIYGLDSVPLPEGERKGHKSWRKEPLRFEILESAVQKARLVLKDDPGLIAAIEWLGRERSLIYKTLALTGLRKNELASITMGQTFLDEKRPYLELKAKNEKAGRGAKIPLRSDLADDIRAFMADKLGKLQAGARQQNLPIPVRLPVNTPLFEMPKGLVNIFDRDISSAGIQKTDELGRTVDVHALRHSFLERTLVNQV
jgi:integrase